MRADRSTRWSATALALAALACSPEMASVDACDPQGAYTPVCGFTNPEDLALVPDTPWILVSQYPEQDRPGSLLVYRAADDRRQVVYPHGPDEGLLSSTEPDPAWGSVDCPGPPDPDAFAPHGIDVRRDRFGAGRVAVVNHGGRQAVELFEVGYAGGAPALGWRGCVPMPPGVWHNDVAFLPRGGFVVTNMMPPPEGLAGTWAGLKIALGARTGSVLVWHPDSGIAELADSGASAPNGVAVSPDGTDLYLAEWGARRVVRLRLGAEPRREEVSLPMRPDNLTWARDGRLLVAGQRGGIGEILACADVEHGNCALPSMVVAIEPTSLEVEVLVDGDGLPGGALSSALEVGGELFLGTFAGDRIVRWHLPSDRP